MSEPLIVTEGQLEHHFGEIGMILRSAIEDTIEVHFSVDWSMSPVVGGILGSGCEYIPRNRGVRTPVVPLLSLQRGLWAWLSYQEEWTQERPNRAIQRYSFRSVSMTVYFGLKNDTYKPQMFRAEWSGWAQWNGNEYSFQAAEAGHPHWQFDALDSLPREDQSELLALLRAPSEELQDQEIREFNPQSDDTDVRAVVMSQKLSRIHFASAAKWWNTPPNNGHAHHPDKQRDVENWVRHALAYLKSELTRLQGN